MENTVNTDLIRDHVDSFILRFLAKSDSYGYDIHKAISTATEGVYEIKQPTLYSCLKRLEKQGFIMSYDGETSNGAQRKYYAITDKGRTFLENDIMQWEFSRTLLDRLLSDKQIDLATAPRPFDPSELRPRTKRGVGVANASLNSQEDDLSPEPASDDIPSSSAEQSSILASSEVTAVVDQSSSEQLVSNDTQPAPLQQDRPTEQPVSDGSPTQTDALSSTEISADVAPVSETPDIVNSDSVEGRQPAPTLQDAALNPIESMTQQSIDAQPATLQQPVSPSEQQPAPSSGVFVAPEAVQIDMDSYVADQAAENRPAEPILQDFLRDRMAENDDYLTPLNALFDTPVPPSIAIQQEEPTPHEDVNHGAFNYSELKERAQSEGYRLHPYSKAVSTSYYSMNFIFSSRLRRDSLLLLYAFMFLEVLISFFTLERVAQLGYLFYIVTGSVLLFFPMLGIILYLIKPDKRVRADFDFKTSISGMIMLMINLVIISMLLAFFLFDADLGRPASLVRPLLYPSLLFINLPIYTLIYAALYGTKRYHLK